MKPTNGKHNTPDGFSDRPSEDGMLDPEFIASMPMEDVMEELDRRNLDPGPLLALVNRKNARIHFLSGRSRWMAVAASVLLLVFATALLIPRPFTNQDNPLANKDEDASFPVFSQTSGSFHLIAREVPREEYIFEKTIQPVPNLYTIAEPFGTSFDLNGSEQEGSTLDVVAFIDPSCPYGQDFYSDLKTLAQEARHARFLFVPVASSDSSLAQVEALYAAREEDKFFEVMDAQVEGMRQQTHSGPVANASGLQHDLLRENIEPVQQLLATLGVDYVPIVVVNGNVIKTPRPRCYSTFL